MLRKLRKLWPCAAMVALVACGSPRYVYAPATTTSADVASGAPAIAYAIPSSAPRGELRVATFGITRLGEAPAVHLRIAVSNRSAEPWSVDGREQRLDVGGARAGLVSATTEDMTTPRALAVAPGETRALDLFFPLPPGFTTPRELTAFDALVVVHAGSTTVTERARFERFASPSSSPALETNDFAPSRLPGAEPPNRWPPPLAPE
jgi:hypothetical protein